ncbi:unnamed protein product, partial [Adineta steineri]
VSLDALRGYQTASAAAGSPYVLATQGGQTIQQPALYAAQLQAVAQQQQQQAQMAAAIQQQQQQQQQQQSLMSGIPAGCMLVRTANGGYALLAQSPTAAAALQSQGQQQYISFNAAGQPTVTRLPAGMVGGQQQQQQQQQVVYQYAGQPTQYIQVPSNYAQQQQLSAASQ